MSGIEALVMAFGLFIGYWLVAKLFAGKPKSNTPEWHDTLHVSPHASVDEIENAYRVLMSQYHPGKVASLGEELKAVAEGKSKEITAAYRRAMQARGMNA
jgi:DnaJ-domain-containing protein 1